MTPGLRLSARGTTFIEEHEALRLIAYRDTRGVLTIGWGHTGPEVLPGLRWSRVEAETAFLKDIAWAVDAVNELVTMALTQSQFDALVSFVFNVGRANFKLSTLLRKVNGGDFVGAGAQFKRWNKITTSGGQLVVSDGLTNRRADEAALFFAKD